MRVDGKQTQGSESCAFDPRSGCQDPSTGLLGGLFVVALASAFAIFQYRVVSEGGPRIPEVFSWYPNWFPDGVTFRQVNRNFYDIGAFVVLTFLFMASWEFARTSVARTYTLGIAALACAGCWSVALQAEWVEAGAMVRFASWDWSRMELVYAGATLGFVLPWFLHLVNPGRGHVLSPPLRALRTAFLRWLAGLLAFTAILFVTFQHPFYKVPYYENWRMACGHLYAVYLIFGFPYAFVTALLRGHLCEDRGDACFMLLMLMRRAGRALFRFGRARPRWSLRNKRLGTVLRDLGVKLFFLPLMITFLYLEFGVFATNFQQLTARLGGDASGYDLFNLFYGSALHGLLLVDVSLGLIGYAAASRWLHNKSKSVDPTLYGWMITLVCYPPFNNVMGGYLPYDSAMGGTPFSIFQPMWVDVLLKCLTLACFAVYVWATTAFGLRFSNLTNRGIIARGPYAFMRHPAYAMKNLAWWCESLRNFTSPWQFVFLAVWNWIYYQRALTEERHLGRDPDYRAYCNHVKWRFIPGVW